MNDLWEFVPKELYQCFSVVHKDDSPLECLGEGGQARVYRIYDGRENPFTGQHMGPIAVKCYPREVLKRKDAKLKRVLREIINHRRLCHKHIVGFREVRLSRKYLFIALNYVHGPSLYKKIDSLGTPLPEDSARWCFQQLMLAVDYLHRRQVANRDISLENILINESSDGEVSIMLCDLGLSRSKVSLEHNGTRSIVGKRGYLAPEVVIRMDRKSFQLAVAGDIYACGVCLYKMLLGIHSWPLYIPDHLSISSLQDLVLKLVCATEALDLQLENSETKLSSECISFLKAILHTNPVQRIKMDQIWSHSWFAKDLPLQYTRAYNDQACSEEFIKEHFSYLQSEVDLRNKVQKAGSDYLPDLWE